MNQKNLITLVIVVAAIAAIAAAVVFWPGSEAEDTAVEVRDAFTGKSTITQGERTKDQLRQIGRQKQQESDSLGE